MVMPSTNQGGKLGTSPPDPGDSGAGWRPGLTPVSLFLVLLLFWIMTQIQIVLVLGLLALLFGTILEGPVAWLERRHFPRPAAIALVYVVIIGGLALLVVAIVPVIADQADTFRQQVPDKIRQLRQDWLASSNPLLNGVGADGLKRALDFFDEPANGVSPDTAQRVLPYVMSVGTGIVSTLSLLVITFYYLLEKSLIRRVVIAQLPERSQGRVDRVWRDVESKVGGWMRGQLFLCLIIGVIATISYGIIDLPFWPLLGLWAGMTEILPIVGPWIGGVPAVILALTVGWDKALMTAIVIIAMQTLENWFLVPRVMRGAVGLSPLAVFLAILAGQQFMGIVGAVLAIPIAAAIQVILTDWLNARHLNDMSPSTSSGWRWMLARATAREDGEPSPDPEGEYQRQSESEIYTAPDNHTPPTDSATSGDALPTTVHAPSPAPTEADDAQGRNPWQWHRRASEGKASTSATPQGRAPREDA